jgi:CheY-like chemotaxis protein
MRGALACGAPTMTVVEILVVDDERPLRELLTALFEELGYRVRSAIHGKEALGLIEQSPPDLIVTDMMMPVLGGVELYQRLKKGVETRAIPIIVMSAGRAGFTELRDPDTFIAKPFDLTTLEVAVRRYLPLPSEDAHAEPA